MKKIVMRKFICLSLTLFTLCFCTQNCSATNTKGGLNEGSCLGVNQQACEHASANCYWGPMKSDGTSEGKGCYYNRNNSACSNTYLENAGLTQATCGQVGYSNSQWCRWHAEVRRPCQM